MDTEDRLYLRGKAAAPVAAFIDVVLDRPDEDVRSAKIAAMIADIVMMSVEREGYSIVKDER
jgi:hypothetical protein